jgi:threonine/homoserine/homoserine lactone efflux protein
MLTYLISGIAYGFAAAATPGPLSMYLISQAVHAGWRRAWPAAFAPLFSDGPIAVLVLIVLSRIPKQFFQYLHIFGGIFILYLAFKTWKSWRQFRTQKSVPIESGHSHLLKAATLNWLNPNPYLGWSTFLGPAVIAGWRQSPACGISLILGFYLTMITVMLAMVLLFSAARAVGQRAQQSIIGIAVIVLACMGIYQIWLGSPILRAGL